MLVLSDEKYHLDNFGYNYRLWKETRTGPDHRHLYFEYIFMLSGTCVHLVNGTTQYLEPNSLTIIRPNDYHQVGALNRKFFECYNVMVSLQEMEAVSRFIGGNHIRSILDSHPISPTLTLTQNEAADFGKNLNPVAGYSVYNPDFKPQSRMLLSYILYKFCNSQYGAGNSLLPQWLNKTLCEMQQKENFAAGLPALLQISGKTHEYLCRVFRKHLGQSPTSFINEIRIKHIKHLLLVTELPIIDIMLDAGFNNISHFNHIFRQRNKCSPSEFRSQYRGLEIDHNLG